MENMDCPDTTYLSCAMESVAYLLDGTARYHTRRFCSKYDAENKGSTILYNNTNTMQKNEILLKF